MKKTLNYLTLLVVLISCNPKSDNRVSFITPVPVGVAIAENSMIMLDAETVAQWYRIVGGTTVYYRTANSALLNNWTTPIKCKGVTGLFPHVFKYGGKYFMFIKKVSDGNIYLYLSEDKISWVVANNGLASIKHSDIPYLWYRNIYNIGVVIIGTRIHILVEGSAIGGFFSSTAWLGYATADIRSPSFTMSETPIIKDGGNPHMYYASKQNAIIVLYGNIDPDYTGHWRLRIATTILNDEIDKEYSWVISPLLFNNMGTDVADCELVVTPGKKHRAMMVYNYGQSTGHVTYTNSFNSINQLYSLVK